MTTAPKPVALETRWRAAAPDLKAFIAQLTASLLADEDGQGLRQRKRRATDQEKFARAVEAICCGFTANALLGDGRAVAVRLGNYASGYTSVYGKHFNRAVDLMRARGLLRLALGHRSGKVRRASTITPSPAYWNVAPPPGDWGDLYLEEHRAFVGINFDESGQRRLTPPEDWLRAATAEVARINDHLRALPLRYNGNEALPLVEIADRPWVYIATPHHRTVRRAFKGSIERGGRLYDGYWETMPRADRFRYLTIGGEPVVNVDYGQLFLRLAYALSGLEPPAGDLYDFTGGDHEASDWPSLREGRKRMVNALISAKRAMRQWPGQTSAERAMVRSLFPAGTKPSNVVAGIKARHHAIAAEWFERGRGGELQRLESDILTAVMLKLISVGIGALPLHDSVIVARSDGEAARRVMLEEAQRIVGADIPVKIDDGR
ncbi:hypothetical protein [Bradyrhizobium sp. BRP56]|uniref:hypothetical protein n=1 Tax=Bradyrhizobium sp. BRP56 TaxID=2793819 RepID=UPI001CD75ACC|nr:hypothetical protein [Bradyrhizobium sp. BRP56]MCA1397221.1 hypothetical protein [Bradyrhizobium sp. BRP56]